MSIAHELGRDAGRAGPDLPVRRRCCPSPADRLLRGVDVAAPADVVYRWVCQFRAAPYSYDWIDNLGRRSPRRPLPWCWDLEVGQTFSRIFTLESFVVGEHLTVRMAPGPAHGLFGDIAAHVRGRPRRSGAQQAAGGDPRDDADQPRGRAARLAAGAGATC